MVKNGGNVLDAYGLVNVVSPCGLPLRGVVGISPDPMMFVALNCQNIEASKTFNKPQLIVERFTCFNILTIQCNKHHGIWADAHYSP